MYKPEALYIKKKEIENGKIEVLATYSVPQKEKKI